MKKIDQMDKMKIGEDIPRKEYPTCFGNYCENHKACSKCPFKEECKEIRNPKEPGWCQ
ncbi:MAG: hypothetical protein JW891_12945 [Candidatus Lokiarchaeota archaeon]|nr:hypothetical protein [Candidatus Lokiarchaeota archaeon]